MTTNRKQRRAEAVLKRKNIQRFTAQNRDIQMNEVEDGVLVLMDTVIEHPVRGPIPIVVDEKMQDALERHYNTIAGSRLIPMNFENAAALDKNDRAVKWYEDLGFPLDHAKLMAARYWANEARDARNSAGMLVLFEYLDFNSPNPPDDPDWETEADMARFGMPPRPEIFKFVAPERKLLWVKNMLRTGSVLSVADQQLLDERLEAWDEQGVWVDAEGKEHTEEPVIPTFAQQFMQVMSDVANRVDSLTAAGVIAAEEPVDEQGFPGEPVGGIVPEADDALGDEA